MRNRATPPTPDPPKDSKGRVRIYADVDSELAKEFSILAIRLGMKKYALLTQCMQTLVDTHRTPQGKK